ncbi:MAG: TetR/AcrR family transcriptional regulator C-terminal domain-containing protein [Lachnospiraceae bacterium]|nr:TetR/AcrR family transcriptional regulator C-terminal domain-containing protein [Lachnospiraceae bacterium]
MNNSDNPSAIRSKKEITQALLTLMQMYPYSEISVKQIILEAKLARKTFYRNYESKDDVLISMIKETLHSYYNIVDTGYGDVLSTVFSFAEKNKEILLLLDKNNMLHIVLQCMNEYGPLLRSEFVSESNPFNILFEGLDSNYLMAFNIGAFWNVISMWIHRGMNDKPEDIMSMIDQYLKRARSLQ